MHELRFAWRSPGASCCGGQGEISTGPEGNKSMRMVADSLTGNAAHFCLSSSCLKEVCASSDVPTTEAWGWSTFGAIPSWSIYVNMRTGEEHEEDAA